MRNHPTSAEVQHKAMGVLFNVAVIRTLRCYRVGVGTSEVWPVWLQLMMVVACAGVLWATAENKPKIIALHGIDRIVAAMRGHSHNHLVQRNACWALWNLAAQSCEWLPAGWMVLRCNGVPSHVGFVRGVWMVRWWQPSLGVPLHDRMPSRLS